MEIMRDDHTTITHRPGDSGTAVMVFTGIKAMFSGTAHEEFGASLGHLRHDLYFVIESPARWYNGSHARIAAMLEAALVARGSARAVTLGTSMGGFGALVFAAGLPNCVRAIAFAAQSSVHPEIVPFETRWQDLRSSITTWEVPDAVPFLSPEIDYAMIIGAEEADDRLHAERILAGTPRAHLIEVPGSRHDSPQVLKARGSLVPILEELIGAGDIERTESLIAAG